MSAVSAVAGAVYAAGPGGPIGLWADSPPARKVLTREIRLGSAELGNGTLAGLAGSPDGLTLDATRTSGQYLSTRLESDIPFHYAGIHWSGTWPGSSEPTFWLRTSEDGTAWSDWQLAQVELPPGPRAEYDAYGSLIGAPGHHFVQFRAEMNGDAGAPVLERVGLTLLNPFDGPELGPAPEPDRSDAGADEKTGAGTIALVLPKPLTFSREAWGCDENLRFAGGQEIWPRDYIPAKTLVVHHTVTPNDYSSIEEAKAQVRSIYVYHTVSQGWGDIGYNCLIDKWGNTYEGRRGREGPGHDGPGGREVLSHGVVAGHALVYNHGSTGVAFLGTFCTPNECAGQAPPGAMVERLKDVLAFECARHGLNPEGSIDFLLRDGGWHRGLPGIVGHRDVGESSCPGGHVYARLPEVRSHLYARLSDPGAPVVAITGSPPASNWHQNRVGYTWLGSGAGPLEFSYYLEGWRYEGDGSVTYLHGFAPDKSPAWSAWSPAGGTEFPIASPGLYTFHVAARDVFGRTSVYHDIRSFHGLPSGVPDGALIQGSGAEVFFVQGGLRRHIPNVATFISRGFNWGNINRVPDWVLNTIPRGRPLLDVLADGNLVRGGGGIVWVMQGGARRHVFSPDVMNSCGYGWDAVQYVPDWILVTMPQGPTLHGSPGPQLSPPDGTILKGGRPNVYVMQAGLKRRIPNPITFEARGLHWGNVDFIAESSALGIPTGDPLLDSLADGNLLKASAPAVYAMDNGRKRHIQSPAVITDCGYGWESVRFVSDGSLAAVPTGSPLGGPPCPPLIPPDGALIKGSAPPVYLMEGGRRRHIGNPGVLASCDYKWGNLNIIPDGPLARIPTGSQVSGSSCPLPLLPDGMVVKGSGPAIYVIQARRKRHILNPDVFVGCHYHQRDVVVLSDGVLARIPLGSPVTGPPCP